MYSDEQPELFSRLSGSDALKLLEIIQASLFCREEKDFRNLFPKIQELFPFEFAGVLSGRCEKSGEVVLVDGMNISYPEEWSREYLEKDYFKLDLGTEHVFKTRELLHWSLLIKDPVLEEYKEVLKDIIALNMDFGVMEGYGHGSSFLSDSGGNGSVFGFSGPSLKYDERTVAILECLIPHLHLAFSSIQGTKDPCLGMEKLSPREKEVLHWMKEGKSSWDMSVILGISTSTTNYHVYNIMKKLGAGNRPQAVAIAARRGLIDFC